MSAKGTTLKNRDFTEGNLFFPLVKYTVPIILTGLLQILYSIADNIVVGRFSGDPNALAAVGSTGSLSAFLINFIIGLTAGSGVLIAQHYGAKNESMVSRSLHTSLLVGLFGGVFMMTLGLVVCRPMLELLGTKSEIIDSSALYISILLVGTPANAVYNFGATALRSTGDSKSPLVILSCAGLINVILNLFFVIVLDMSVAGVASATIISQYLSAIAVLVVLHRRDDCVKFSFSKLKIDKAILLRILRLGVPAGVQSSLFAVSNMLIQSAINTFSTAEIAGSTICSNIESFIYVAINSYLHAMVTFVGQNYGANRPDRIKKTVFFGLIQAITVGFIVAALISPFKEQISYLFVDPAAENATEVVAAAVLRAQILIFPYVLAGFMEVFSGTLRGLGFSIYPTCASLFGICAFRIFWCRVIFPLDAFNNFEGLFIVYPLSWILVALIDIPGLLIGIRRLTKLSKNKLRNKEKSAVTV